MRVSLHVMKLTQVSNHFGTKLTSLNGDHINLDCQDRSFHRPTMGIKLLTEFARTGKNDLISRARVRVLVLPGKQVWEMRNLSRPI